MLKNLFKILLIVFALFGSFEAIAQKKIAENYDTRIDALIKKMTLEEKVNMVHANSSFTSPGVSRLGIPELKMSDGPHGVRPEFGRDWNPDLNVYDSGTYLPTGNCLAATWNTKLGYNYGAVLGSEANFRGKDVILGPGINIIRTPLNGRNFEYQSEDPYLTARMAVGYIKGVQDQGISACVKHYAANNQEVLRTSIDVQMSERALREIYLPAFKAAVQEGKANTLMGSYNKFRGQWVTQNNYLMNQVLKKEWGFNGIVISDWGAVHTTTEAMWNGCDLEMGTDLSMLPNPNYGKFYFGDTLTHMIRNKIIPEYLLDDKVKRILNIMFKTNIISGNRMKGEYNTKGHQQLALKVAEEGIVLLKNQDILPLKTNAVKKIAVIGVNAQRFQSMGGGSSQVKAFYEITPLKGIQNLAGNNISVSYDPGYKIERGGKADADLINDAVKSAAASDVAIIVCGWTHGYDYNVWADNAYDAEDTDKPDMKMPFGQDELVKAVIKANPNSIVVIMGGGGIDMSQWVNDAKGIIQAWYPGMEGGNALSKILFGQISPSGKLPMTLAKKLEDVPAHKLGQYPGDGKSVFYYDDIYVGYRYYDTYKVEPEFPFGHGLSYSTFSFSNLKVTPGGTSGLKKATLSFQITNTGKMAAAEVAQVYVKQMKSLLPRPEKELKAFEKVFLQPGEKKIITLTLNEDAFQYFNDVTNEWVSESGLFEILIGNSSRDIKISQTIKL